MENLEFNVFIKGQYRKALPESSDYPILTKDGEVYVFVNNIWVKVKTPREHLFFNTRDCSLLEVTRSRKGVKIDKIELCGILLDCITKDVYKIKKSCLIKLCNILDQLKLTLSMTRNLKTIEPNEKPLGDWVVVYDSYLNSTGKSVVSNQTEIVIPKPGNYDVNISMHYAIVNFWSKIVTINGIKFPLIDLEDVAYIGDALKVPPLTSSNIEAVRKYFSDVAEATRNAVPKLRLYTKTESGVRKDRAYLNFSVNWYTVAMIIEDTGPALAYATDLMHIPALAGTLGTSGGIDIAQANTIIAYDFSDLFFKFQQDEGPNNVRLTAKEE